MDLILTTKCNLKCSGCCYLFNKYEEGEFLDADMIIKQADLIRTAIEEEEFVSLIGGETFLYPDLVKVLKHVQEYNISQCTIFTNGTIYPSYMEELCQVANEKIHILIGSYGNKEVIEKIQQTCNKYKVSCVCRDDELEWVEHGDFIPHNEKKIKFCNFRYSTLMKGKVFACGRFAQAWNLGLIKLEDMDELEYVDIYDKDALSKLHKMYWNSFDHYSSTCNYCLRGSKKSIKIVQGK